MSPAGRTAPRGRLANLTLDDWIARGREARGQAPRSGHARWEPAPGRPDQSPGLRRYGLRTLLLAGGATACGLRRRTR